MAKIYHHNDHDGRLAAFWAFQNLGGSPEFIEMTYGKDAGLDKVKPDEEVWIVDFSFEPEVMKQLINITTNVVWVDHHISAIKKFDGFNWGDSKVIRCLSEKHAACMLTWAVATINADMSGDVTDLILGFLNKSEDRAPWATKYVADFDAWKMVYPDSVPFVLGLDMEDESPTSDLWYRLNKGSGASLEDNILAKGSIIKRYKDKTNAEYLKSFGFDVEWSPLGQPLKCKVLNLGRSSSLAFGDDFGRYDVCVSCVYMADHWEISLYSDKVDVSKIAAKFEYNGRKGGGHKGASGFSCEELPWERS